MSSAPANEARPLPAAGATNTGPAPAAGRAECFHCGLPVPPGLDLSVVVGGGPRPMCCAGCAAVAQAIVDNHLEAYYRHRTAPADRAFSPVPGVLEELAIYDNAGVQKSFVRAEDGDRREAALVLEGITCAACIWLNEKHLAALPGVAEVNINYATHRARIAWDESRIRLSEILAAVAAIGYRAYPYDPGRSQQVLEKERRDYLRRIGVAGALGMQVMLLAVALYSGAWSGMDEGMREFFRRASLLLCLPVLVYSAQPFFASAWIDLRRGRAGMDVPVSLGIALAFAASTWAAVTGEGEVYFDSVVMFVFFLLGARFLELLARRKAALASESLVRMLPATAHRLTGEDAARTETVPVAELVPGERVLVRPGENVPADGVIVEGSSGIDESVLTGEHLPRVRRAGDEVTGGAVNIENPLVVEVRRTGPDTVLSGIVRLLERAQGEKQHLALAAERIAGWFVGALLLVAAVTAAYWWQAAPDRWLAITVAVLVVTCPCALSLATPAAAAAATGALISRGLLTTRGHALETLAQATHFVFDKTGTLTSGRPELTHVLPFGEVSEERCLRLAAALETWSEHPLAQAVRERAGEAPLPAASGVRAVAGGGVTGSVEGGALHVGSPDFIRRKTGLEAPAGMVARHEEGGRTIALLATDAGVLAALVFADTIRPGAKSLVSMLRAQAKTVIMLTGDAAPAARHVADRLGIDHFEAGLSPAQKLEYVEMLAASGAVVAMCGDGVNDAPVLGAAHVSIAMGNASPLSAAGADMILLSEDIGQVGHAVRTARKTLRIIRENLAWALSYNAVAVPAAVAGLVAPWMAALGMSLSSLVVVGNSLRLARGGKRSGQD